MDLLFQLLARASAAVAPITDPRFALVGDSLTQYTNEALSLNGATMTRDAAGVVTVAKAGHGIFGAQPVNIVNCSTASYEATATTTYIDANNFSYPTGVTGQAGSITGGSLTQAVIQNRIRTISYWAWLQSMMKGGGRLRGNFGQGGDRLDEMASAVALACATDAEIVVLEGGINDINGGAASGATVISRMQTHVDTVLAAGKKALLVGITPLGAAFNSSAKNTEILAANAGYAAMAAANPSNVWFASAHADLTDGTNNNQAYSWATYDGIHWGQRASRLVAQRIYETIQSKIVTQSILPTSSSNLPAVLGYTAIKQYGNWSGSGVASTAQGCTGTRTANIIPFSSVAGSNTACSLEDRGDGTGYWQRMVVTPSGTNHSVTAYLAAVSGETLASLGLVAGDEVYLAVEVKVQNANASGLLGIWSDIRSNSSGAQGIAYCGQYDAAAATGNDAIEDVLITGPLKINASFTHAAGTIGTRFAAASANQCTIDIGRVTLFRKPA